MNIAQAPVLTEPSPTFCDSGKESGLYSLTEESLEVHIEGGNQWMLLVGLLKAEKCITLSDRTSSNQEIYTHIQHFHLLP